jgi:hypothetical protein
MHSILQQDENGRLDAARDWLMGHFTDHASEKYAPADGKLRLIEAILDNGWVAVNETWKLQALGVAFGDALSQELTLEWVTVEDEFGRDPALNWPGTSVYSYPLTMISKRVERGEQVHVRALFKVVCDDLREMAFSARFI